VRVCLPAGPPKDNLREEAWTLKPVEDGMKGMYQLTSPDHAKRELFFDPADNVAVAMQWIADVGVQVCHVPTLSSLSWLSSRASWACGTTCVSHWAC
jgi:hypothetical protein